MLQSIREYSSIVTKIKAMNKQLLNEQDYQSLMMSHSLADIVRYLRQHQGYRDLFADTDDILYHRADLEKILFKNVLSDYVKLYKFSDIRHRKFLMFHLEKYNIRILKLCLNMIHENNKGYNLLTYKDFFDQYSKIDLSLLSGSSSVKDFITNLAGTEYYEALKGFLNADTANVFDYETALDLHYFKNIWKYNSKILTDNELKLFKEAVGTDIDMLNIQWIYRLKKYYNMSGENINALLIPVYYKLRKQEVKALAESADEKEFNDTVNGTYYSKLVKKTNSASIEKAYHSILENVHTAQARKHPYSMATINNYLYKKETEIKKLTTIIECVKYDIHDWAYVSKV